MRTALSIAAIIALMFVVMAFARFEHPPALPAAPEFVPYWSDCLIRVPFRLQALPDAQFNDMWRLGNETGCRIIYSPHR